MQAGACTKRDGKTGTPRVAVRRACKPGPIGQQTKKQRAASLSSLPLMTYPARVSRNQIVLLVERVEGQNARFGGGADAGWVDANDRIFLSAESANAGLVNRKRHGHGDVAYVDAAHYGARAC